MFALILGFFGLACLWFLVGYGSAYLWSWDDYGDDCVEFKFKPISRGAALFCTVMGLISLGVWLLLTVCWIIFKGIPDVLNSKGWFSKPFR